MARDGGPSPLTAEESRYLDGALSPERLRRMERLLAADPDRADRVRAWNEWMTRWREDCRAAAPTDDVYHTRVDQIVGAALDAAPSSESIATMNTERLAEAQGSSSGWSVPAHVARRYAAAALLLMALGLVGYAVTRTDPAVATPHGTTPVRNGSNNASPPSSSGEARGDLHGIRDAIRSDVLRPPTRDVPPAPIPTRTPSPAPEKR